VEKVRALIATIAPGQAEDVTVTADHKLKVQGYAKDRAMQTRLMQALENVSPQPASQFYVDADMLEASKQILDTRLDPARARLRAIEINGGVLTMQGAVSSQSVRDATTEILHANVPGLKEVTGTVIVAEELPPVFMERLTENGLARKMQLVSKQPELVLRGTLTEDEMKRWEKLLLSFTEEYGKVLPIRANITVGQRKLPVNVQTIVGGITPFVMSADGQRTTRGGDSNGHTLVTVKDNEIVFEGGEKFRIGR
jgi:type III secretion system YscD/HrpQ family protein